MKKFYLTILLMLMIAVGAASAAIEWTDSAADSLWSSAANWDVYVVPIATDNALLDLSGSHTVIDGTVTAVANYVYLTQNNGDTYLDITGGTLDAQRLYVAYTSSSGLNQYMNVSGDAVVNFTYTIENRYGDWELNISDNASVTTPIFWAGRYGGNAVINLNGGSLNLTNSAYSILVGTGTMTVDITEGQLTNAGNWSSAYGTLVTNEQVTAYGGLGEVVITYDSVNNKTILTAIAPDAKKASDPIPSNEASFDILSLPTSLSWTAGQGALTHDVYFGDSSGFLSMVDNVSSTNITLADYGITLEQGKNYYWRVDEVGSSETTPGTEWQFSVENYLVIDDFQSYVSDSNLLTVWAFSDSASGLGVSGGGNPLLELAYSNSIGGSDTGTMNVLPFSDFSVGNMAAVQIRFSGTIGNGAVDLSVSLSDGTNTAVVDYNDINSNLTNSADWIDWIIGLDEFVGVDASSLDSLTLTLTSNGEAGSGTVNIAAIYLYGQRCFNNDNYDLRSDANGDCVIDLKDFAITAGSWLNSGLSAAPLEN